MKSSIKWLLIVTEKPSSKIIQILDKNILDKNDWNTFWKVVAGLNMAGKINGGDKYGGLVQKPPHYPRHNYPT